MNSVASITSAEIAAPESMQIKRGPLLASLFCGAGGLDVGFLKAGFDVGFAADYDAAAIATYNNNHKGKKAQVIDLLETPAEKLYKMAISAVGSDSSFDGIIGGPPCQGFSRGNVGRCHSDPRNKLALKYADIVNLFHINSGVKFFVFENVPEILATKNKDFLGGLKSRLSEHFNIFEKEINASRFGVPQLRRRYFIVGIAKSLAGASFEFPAPTCEVSTVVADFISDLPEPAFFSREIKIEDIPHHPNHWTMRPKSKRFLSGDMPTGGRSFIKVEWDKPSRTVAYGNREIHIHPSGTRRLSIYEAMLLQGFEHDYVLSGNLSEQVKQVSNAVPPPVALQIAKSLREQLFKDE